MSSQMYSRLPTSLVLFKNSFYISIPLPCIWDVSRYELSAWALHRLNGDELKVYRVSNSHISSITWFIKWNFNVESPVLHCNSDLFFSNPFNLFQSSDKFSILSPFIFHHPNLLSLRVQSTSTSCVQKPWKHLARNLELNQLILVQTKAPHINSDYLYLLKFPSLPRWKRSFKCHDSCPLQESTFNIDVQSSFSIAGSRKL